MGKLDTTRSSRERIRRTAADKTRIIQVFEAAQQSGEKAEAIADRLGVPRATLYRWRNEHAALESQSLQASEAHSHVDLVIDAILRVVSENDLKKLEAFVSFIVWKRWPNDPFLYGLGMASCLASYFSQKSQAVNAAELEETCRSLLNKYISLDDLVSVCSAGIVVPSFKVRNEFNLIIRVVHFLISYEPRPSMNKANVSIAKAHFLLQEGALGMAWHVDYKTFRTLWLETAGAAPFHFVDSVRTSLDWTLDPGSPSFATGVDVLLKTSRATLESYFAQAKWVAEKLDHVLSAAARENIDLPAFPSWLKAEMPLVDAPPESWRLILKRYRNRV